MSDLKNVVVVGLGFAGLSSAKAIAAGLPATHRVVVINEYNFAYNPPASLRAATVPGWEDKVTVPLTAVFPKDSRHVVLGGVKVVQLGAESIKLEKAVEGFGSEIPFEYAVIATGSSYATPTRIAQGAETEADVWKTLKEFQSDVKDAESVLVVGGGATGVEFAAEVASQHKGKKVTLVHSADRLFAHKDFKSALGNNLASQLKKKGVKIVFNSKVDPKGLETGKIPKQTFALSDGSSVEADFLFIGHGWKPNSEVVSTLDPALINDGGFVRVTPTLQLKSAIGAYDHIFAAGDVNDVPVRLVPSSLRSPSPPFLPFLSLRDVLEPPDESRRSKKLTHLSTTHRR
ncbi:hypothetical protein BCR35DRAFT_53716 [Leucosporidium creatinivorum]|uniref:FAD/NAD(P)-binding domain-containing protein n=1 Tax=Leucosporidium creatinivorum TaxID=106004 RepID=A0A1Y2FMY7_9BASI|nr:hypothetical protein BCR35DRAFT_53716 [Leucosporidium creatinivorum]